jgi:Xaa-Pro aminopeptidase
MKHTNLHAAGTGNMAGAREGIASRRALIGAFLGGVGASTLAVSAPFAGIAAHTVQGSADPAAPDNPGTPVGIPDATPPAANDADLVRQKLDQATQVLSELDIDLWMPVARESDTLGDPILPLILGTSVTWESAFLISRTGNHRAIVGSGDVENVGGTGAWDDVVGYVQDFGEALREAIAEYDPQTLALNYSIDNFMADGLTHGMYLRLEDILTGTPYWERVVSGEPVSVHVRSRKSVEEQRRIRQAVATTVEIWNETGAWLQPGLTELEIAAFMHDQLDARGVTSAWDRAYCPTVIAGPDSPGFHAGPGEFAITPGETLAIDFGVRQDLYTSDMQRCWYLLAPGETDAPTPVREAFAVVDEVIQSAARTLRPGVRGWEVDKVGRDIFAEAGFEEWPYALGHQIGRIEHDGGTMIAPKWERYGTRPDGIVEVDEVYALEIGTLVAGYGWVSLEENIVVTEDGAEFLAKPQRELMLIG